MRASFAGINPADTLQRAGSYPPPPGAPADIPGLEVCGTVEDVRRGCDALASGRQGLRARRRRWARRPRRRPRDERRRGPGLARRARGGRGRRGLHHRPRRDRHAVRARRGRDAARPRRRRRRRLGGLSDRGRARARASSPSCGPMRQPRRSRSRGRAGRDERFGDEVAEKTAGEGVDVILELVGAPHFPANLDVLAGKGRIVVVGVGAGAEAVIPLLALMQKRASMRGTVLRPRSVEEKADAVAAFERDVVPALAARAGAPRDRLGLPARGGREGVRAPRGARQVREGPARSRRGRRRRA